MRITKQLSEIGFSKKKLPAIFFFLCIFVYFLIMFVYSELFLISINEHFNNRKILFCMITFIILSTQIKCSSFLFFFVVYYAVIIIITIIHNQGIKNLTWLLTYRFGKWILFLLISQNNRVFVRCCCLQSLL